MPAGMSSRTRRAGSSWRRLPHASSSTSRGRAAGSTRRPTSVARRPSRPPWWRASCRSGGACSRWSSRACPSASRAPSSTTSRAAPRMPTSTTSRRRRAASRWPRTSRSSTAGTRPGSPASRRPRPISRSGSPTTSPRARATSHGPSRSCCRAGSAGRTASRSSPEVYKSVVETTEHGGYPLFDHLRKILDGPLVWAPGVDGGVVAQPARRRLPLRVRSGHRDRLRQPRRRERRAVLRRELQLPRRDARGGGRAAHGGGQGLAQAPLAQAAVHGVRWGA